MTLKLILRCEENANEKRTPLIPHHVKILNENGVECLVESSPQRIFSDYEYRALGCKVIERGSWQNADLDWTVIGLKALPENTKMYNQKHIYFAHSYRGQAKAKILLEKFIRDGGSIIDLEYITSSQGSRLTSMSHYAGIAGCIMGLNEYLGNLYKVNDNTSEMQWLNRFISHHTQLADIRIVVTGSEGRCGRGVCTFLEQVGLSYDTWTLNDSINNRDLNELRNFDIIFHAAAANTVGCNAVEDTKVMISEEMIKGEHNIKVIVDITADLGSPYNLLGFNYTQTSFDDPCFKIATNLGNKVSVIAIDHLPTLLARESSIWFSNQLLPILANENSSPLLRSLERFNQETNLLRKS